MDNMINFFSEAAVIAMNCSGDKVLRQRPYPEGIDTDDIIAANSGSGMNQHPAIDLRATNTANASRSSGLFNLE